MRRQVKKWLTRILVLLLMFSTPSLACGEWIAVPKGWVTPSQGVFGDEQTARDTAAALRGRRLEAGIWHETTEQIQDEVDQLGKKTDERLTQLEQDLQRERQEWQTKQQRQRQQVIFWSLISVVLGAVAGNNL